MGASKTFSPKVVAGAITSIGLTVLVAALGAISPNLFDGLGVWGPVVYAAVVAIGGAIAGYVKTDPLRY